MSGKGRGFTIIFHSNLPFIKQLSFKQTSNIKNIKEKPKTKEKRRWKFWRNDLIKYWWMMLQFFFIGWNTTNNQRNFRTEWYFINRFLVIYQNVGRKRQNIFFFDMWLEIKKSLCRVCLLCEGQDIRLRYLNQALSKIRKWVVN